MIVKSNEGKVLFIFDQECDGPVFLAGDFNNWNYTLDPMNKKEGKWKATKDLKPGAYQFRYVILDVEGEHWFNDWRADTYTKSPFGGENSVIIIE